ncbi:hypothetical protein [Bosea sp. (in: a-proteobacteria)]
MVKPPPTRTRAKVPVSLPPVNALSSAPADAKSAPLTPAARPAPVPVPAPAAPARPAAPVAGTAAPAPKPAPASAPPAGSPARAAPAPASAPAKAPGKPSKKIVSAKLRIEKPVAKLAARRPADPAPPTARETRPAQPGPAAAKTAADKPAVAKPTVAKPVASRPAVVAPVVAMPAEPSKPAPVTPAAPRPAAAAPVAPAGKEAAKPAPLDSLPLPRPPEFAALTSETVMSQALTMARAFGALQAKMLEHACSELKATLGEAETLARSDSASEAITLQAKAVRRSYESYAEHLKELARIANAALRKG